MKKLLAILLILLIPFCACAETRGMTICVDTDDVLFPQLLQEVCKMMLASGEGNQDAWIQLIQNLFNGLELDFKIQEDAFSTSTAINGIPVFDLNLYTTVGESKLTSTLLPGYAIVLNHDSLATNAPHGVTGNIELDSVLQSVGFAFEKWISNFEPSTDIGSFHGDAYEGGTWCTTVSFTDSDIAALLSSIATYEVRSAISQTISSMGFDARKVLDAFDAVNARVADEDTYLYLLRFVGNEEKLPIGASLTILREQEQVATISFGFSEDRIRLVTGLGLNRQNYWWEFSAVQTKSENITYWSGTSREWLAAKTESFAYTKANNQVVACTNWLCSITASGERFLWDGAVYQGEVRDAEQRMLAFNGKTLPSTGEMDVKLVVGTASKPVLSVTIHTGQAEAIAPEQVGLQTCTVSSLENSALFADLLNQFAAGVTARLIKILPLELILELSQMMSP